jgi:hypothetical protein
VVAPAAADPIFWIGRLLRWNARYRLSQSGRQLGLGLRLGLGLGLGLGKPVTNGQFSACDQLRDDE